MPLLLISSSSPSSIAARFYGIEAIITIHDTAFTLWLCRTENTRVHIGEMFLKRRWQDLGFHLRLRWRQLHNAQRDVCAPQCKPSVESESEKGESESFRNCLGIDHLSAHVDDASLRLGWGIITPFMSRC